MKVEEKPAISVVIPAYNEEKYLPQCFKALNNQRFSLPYEIIVVDNNSSDLTAKIARKMKARVVFEKKKGVGPARQRGTVIAGAPIIAQLDADTMPDASWLSEIYKMFSTDKDKQIIGVSGPMPFFDATWPTKFLVNQIYDKLVFQVLPLFCGNAFFRGGNFAFRKSVWKDVGGYSLEAAWHEDLELAKRLKNKGEIIFNPRQIVFCSARRLKRVGILKTFFSILKNLFKIHLLKQKKIPIEDCR